MKTPDKTETKTKGPWRARSHSGGGYYVYNAETHTTCSKWISEQAALDMAEIMNKGGHK